MIIAGITLPPFGDVIWALVGICLLVLLAPRALATGKKDDSDGVGKDKESGLFVHTDQKTGVQYVSTPLGGITPRLNPDGTPHCVPTKPPE